MDKNLNLPREYDVVLGGQNLAPIGAAVLGGMEGQIKCLVGANTKIEVAAFQTVTVSDRGEIIHRETKKARSFIEDFGNGITLEMVYIPGGSFLMNSSEGKEYDIQKPQHQVTVEPFFIGKFQVTQAQWKAVASLPIVNRNLRSNPAYFGNDEFLPILRGGSWHSYRNYCGSAHRYIIRARDFIYNSIGFRVVCNVYY